MTTQRAQQARTVREHDRVIMAELTGAVATAIASVTLYLTREYLYLSLLLAAAAYTVFYLHRLSSRAARRNRVKTLRWRTKCRMVPGRGYASTADVAVHLSRAAAVKHGGRARPSMSRWARITAPATDYSVRAGRAQYGTRVYSPMEDQRLTVGPPRKGKTALLADRIVDHPGGLVASSTRPDLFYTTRRDRALRGRVEVFNPQRLGGPEAESTMRFDLIGPCIDMAAARRMASWLANGPGGVAHGNIEWFEKKGEVALSGLLFAAAVTGATIADVYGWVQRDGHEIALKALDEYGTSEMAATVRRMLDESKTAGSVRDTIDLVLSWATLPELAESVTRRPGEPMLDVADLALRNGSLFLIGRGDDSSPLTPLYRALVSYIHYEAGVLGTRSPAGRLDPPLLLALDEVCQVCPVDLPGILADSAGYGLLVEPVAHSVSQLRNRYGEAGAATIWSLCGTKMLLPGISDPDTVRNVAQLLDRVEVAGRDVDIVPGSFLRTLPDWHALLIVTNRDPVVVRFRPVWRRADRRWPVKYLTRQHRAHRTAARAVTTLESVDVPAVTRVLEPEIDSVRDYAGMLPGQPQEPEQDRPAWTVQGERARGR